MKIAIIVFLWIVAAVCLLNVVVVIYDVASAAHDRKERKAQAEAAKKAQAEAAKKAQRSTTVVLRAKSSPRIVQAPRRNTKNGNATHAFRK